MRQGDRLRMARGPRDEDPVGIVSLRDPLPLRLRIGALEQRAQRLADLRLIARLEQNGRASGSLDACGKPVAKTIAAGSMKVSAYSSSRSTWNVLIGTFTAPSRWTAWYVVWASMAPSLPRTIATRSPALTPRSPSTVARRRDLSASSPYESAVSAPLRRLRAISAVRSGTLSPRPVGGRAPSVPG